MIRRRDTRMCRSCRRDFELADLVIEAPRHDELGYLVSVSRWCEPCAVERLLEMEAFDDPTNLLAGQITDLRAALGRFEGSRVGA